MKKLLLYLTISFFSFNYLFAGDFGDRKQVFIDAVIEENNFDTGLDKMIVQVYSGYPINADSLVKFSSNLENTLADFQMTRLIRILFLTDGTYDDIITSAIQPIKMWFGGAPQGEQNHTTENHMIMWMSAHHLLEQTYGWEGRETLRSMIIHYLDLKIEYGYYEFLSPIYLKYTLAGILNLADFSEDEEISSKASKAAIRLLKEILYFTNDEGVFYSVAGRAQDHHFKGSGRYKEFAYLFAGLGEFNFSPWVGTSAILTSNVDFFEVEQAWTPYMDTTFHWGHTLEKSFELNANLSREDRTVFQQSMGAYFHPKTADDTYWMFNFYETLGTPFVHDIIEFLISESLINTVAQIGNSISVSSYLGQQNINLYKNDGVVLSSVHDYMKGKLGWQQFPWMATIGNRSVYTACGYDHWITQQQYNANTSLPYVDQKENVALIMYRHNWDLPLLTINKFDVRIVWEKEYFDEIIEIDKWTIARIDNDYIGIRKYCEEEKCNKQAGQAWGAIVGNSTTHGSFDSFIEVIENSNFESRWYFNWQTFKWVFYAKIEVDGKMIDYHWNGSFLSDPQRLAAAETEDREALQLEQNNIGIWPNPAQSIVHLKVIDNHNYQDISIFDMSGKLIKNINLDDTNSKMIDVSSWSNGVYTIVSTLNNGENGVQRLMVNH